MTDQRAIVFRALHIANERRGVHGLRYNDFTRYRKHCANRTHRLRSILKLTHGKGRDFKKLLPFTLEVINGGHLQLLLFEAERAWAYSQELISRSSLPESDRKARPFRHAAKGRFRRAIHWSTQLLSHCYSLHAASRLSSENLLEVTIYALILNGRFLRFRDDFEDALIQLSVARGLLDEMAELAETSRDQALAVLFSDELGPEIRHCAHEMGWEKPYDISGIVQEFYRKNRGEIVPGCDELIMELREEVSRKESGQVKKKLEPLIWEGKPVSVRNPELVDVLIEVQETRLKLDGQCKWETKDRFSSKGITSKKAVAAYDSILLALSDAEEVARKLSEAQQINGSIRKISFSESGHDYHFIHAFIVYQLLSRRIQRDLLLVSCLLSTSKITSPKEISVRKSDFKPPFSQSEQVDSRLYPAVVKLLDSVLQSLEEIRSLSIVDDSLDVASAIEARVTYTKARRCLFLAHCYLPTKKFAEAVTLIHHAQIHIRGTKHNLDLIEINPASDMTQIFFSLDMEDINDLDDAVTSDSLQIKREWFTYNGGSVESEKKMYQKLLFFNIALNYVHLDTDQLKRRGGRDPGVTYTRSVPATGMKKQEVTTEKKPALKTKLEDDRSLTSETPYTGRSGLSTLLGGWWGKS